MSWQETASAHLQQVTEDSCIGPNGDTPLEETYVPLGQQNWGLLPPLDLKGKRREQVEEQPSSAESAAPGSPRPGRGAVDKRPELCAAHTHSFPWSHPTGSQSAGGLCQPASWGGGCRAGTDAGGGGGEAGTGESAAAGPHPAPGSGRGSFNFTALLKAGGFAQLPMCLLFFSSLHPPLSPKPLFRICSVN